MTSPDPSASAATGSGGVAFGGMPAGSPCPNPLPKGEGTYAANRLSQGTETERPEGHVVGQPPREHSGQASGGVRGQPLRPGEWEPRHELPPERKYDGQNENHPKPQSLAVRRGEDWGLREAGRGSVGITRPMRIECHANRLIVISDRGPGNNRMVPLGPRTVSSIDLLITAVWEQMGTWGMAGRGMYWKPVLQIRVAPDAERRFVELAALLEGSGLTIVRK